MTVGRRPSFRSGRNRLAKARGVRLDRRGDRGLVFVAIDAQLGIAERLRNVGAVVRSIAATGGERLEIATPETGPLPRRQASALRLPHQQLRDPQDQKRFVEMNREYRDLGPIDEAFERVAPAEHGLGHGLEPTQFSSATPGREPEMAHLRSVVGRVWRSVVVWLLLLALLTFARLLG